ncbi:B46 [miniopterid betaherpesvirus 1]|uniref:B46 n=1 Tax=miniopterid betaherpesvirus 1 TaxID=3070189 RepID=I3VQ32_9BETA|nr:B46 [miniopterid betaherpesvirus 1]AFK83876.1 B46 [miniopterid betaherpesvirus 1]
MCCTNCCILVAVTSVIFIALISIFASVVKSGWASGVSVRSSSRTVSKSRAFDIMAVPLGDVLKKRSYDQVTGRDSLNKMARLRRVEEDLVAKYIYGSDHGCTYSRFFVNEGLLGLEPTNLGSLMFRVDTGAESPRTVIVSLFLLAIKCNNVSVATRTLLRTVYSSASASAALDWLELVIDNIHKKIHVVGCVNSVSSGITSMITCVMRGNSYNALKTEIYPLMAPKEMYVDLDGEVRGGEITYVYCVIVYDYEAEVRASIYIVASFVSHRATLLSILRHRFSLARLLFLDRYVVRPRSVSQCVGVVQRLGWCLRTDIKSGSAVQKNLQIPIIRFESFYTDLGQPFEFI